MLESNPSVSALVSRSAGRLVQSPDELTGLPLDTAYQTMR